MNRSKKMLSVFNLVETPFFLPTIVAAPLDPNPMNLLKSNP